MRWIFVPFAVGAETRSFRAVVEGFEGVREYLKARSPYNPEGFVFCQDNGNPYEPRIYLDLYQKVLKQAGVPYRNFHVLRHTFATRAYQLSFDLPTLAGNLRARAKFYYAEYVWTLYR